MKYAVILGDGMADYPIPELSGKTPLASANKPCMDYLADRAVTYGLVKTTIAGLPAGSDVANLSAMGYDPRKYYTGRGPLEAASIGIPLKPADVAFRCNLITADDNVVDYSAGHITTQEASELMRYLDSKLGTTDTRFYPGISYRHLLVIENCPDGIVCTAPHDVVGQPVQDNLPKGEGSEKIIGLIEASRDLLASHPINKKRIAEGKRPANSIWPWGQGRKPSMPTFRDRYGLDGAVISAVDLIKGLGVFAGLEVINVPGATGYLDTDYGAKAVHALKALENKDFVFVHVEAPDEMSHEGRLKDKIRAIEDLDGKLIRPILEGLKSKGDFRLMVLPDHPTPLATKTHAYDPVPYIIYDSRYNNTNNKRYDEESMKNGRYIADGHELMGLFIHGDSQG
ncbi:cofactor-independent phosphoglycerate mutase [Methanocella arvoryzae]|uniref:phosphoglycerate mutase (2,3-diphosphoglycerate-independent) n=1 Tax=Methanocella arvoryzae (strain DSM 22066 / NBRC 105507 / MRE50) TaxID=351160 RepID=Q0W2X3_METAR|nr:cofactor-independent phosphoglycerate mutase [Methanocella arvoryzae]CAJ37270.1 2,3-bisphosphoglycerate-independent phosphoglycerate mutase [Methanocella arvoryzae MRE50]